MIRCWLNSIFEPVVLKNLLDAQTVFRIGSTARFKKTFEVFQNNKELDSGCRVWVQRRRDLVGLGLAWTSVYESIESDTPGPQGPIPGPCDLNAVAGLAEPSRVGGWPLPPWPSCLGRLTLRRSWSLRCGTSCAPRASALTSGGPLLPPSTRRPR